MTKKTILVVGGAGYIGSQVNKLLNQRGYHTVVFDNLSRGNKNAVIAGDFALGDMANLADLENVFHSYKIHAVMHFAAFTDVGESFIHPSRYYQNNVVNTLNLLNTMLQHHVKYFIFSSSAAIFGLPQEKSINEEHPTLPINPYGHTKLMVETILKDFDHAYGLKSCCLRYFNAAGGDPEGAIKSFKRKETNLIPLVLRSLQDPNGKITIYGIDYPTIDGTCIRDYIHVYDLSEAHITGMEKLLAGTPSSFYNLGNGNGYSVREVIQAAEKVTGLPVNVVEGDRRPGDPSVLVANAQKAHKELNWKPKYPDLEKMIQHAWQAMK